MKKGQCLSRRNESAGVSFEMKAGSRITNEIFASLFSLFRDSPLCPGYKRLVYSLRLLYRASKGQKPCDEADFPVPTDSINNAECRISRVKRKDRSRCSNINFSFACTRSEGILVSCKPSVLRRCRVMLKAFPSRVDEERLNC